MRHQLLQHLVGLAPDRTGAAGHELLPDGWEMVIGLEVHAELATASKMFSPAPNSFGGEPNTNCTASLLREVQPPA